MDNDYVSSSYGLAIPPQARCLVGVYGYSRESNLDEDDLNQHFSFDEESDSIQFLVGCQSLRPEGSQIHLITVVDPSDIQSTHLTKQTFIHGDGEVIDLCTIAAQPQLFVSVYSAFSAGSSELRTGARVWRLPSNAICTGEQINSPRLDIDNKSTLDNRIGSTIGSSTLEYVTTLPLEDFVDVKRIISHPSTVCSDLACLTGPPIAELSGRGVASGKAATVWPNSSWLTVLQAPDEGGGGGEYRVKASARLCLPSSLADRAQSPRQPSLLTTGSSVGDVVAGLKIDSTEASAGASPLVTGCPVSSSVTAMRWSPHRQGNQIAVAFDSAVLGWDIRCMQPCFWLESAHWPRVHSVDFNPHRAHLLVSGGEDGCVKLWDLRFLATAAAGAPLPSGGPGLVSSSASLSRPRQRRSMATTSTGGPEMATKPLVELKAHSHWVWSVRYHPTRDQLLLSSGSDSRVCLYALPSYSSDALDTLVDRQAAPFGSAGLTPKMGGEGCVGGGASCADRADSQASPGTNGHSKMTDGLIQRIEQHEESVYAVDWSPVDAWFFASVSYDGNLMVNRVPESVKLNLLLLRDELYAGDDSDGPVDRGGSGSVGEDDSIG